MRFLGIGIGHCDQHCDTTAEPDTAAENIADNSQTCFFDEESDDDEESAGFEDEEDEDLPDDEDEDEDFGYGDL